MRWYEILALILMGALFGGAFLFGTDWAVEKMVWSEAQPSYLEYLEEHPVIVESHRENSKFVMRVVGSVAVLFLLAIRFGRTLLRKSAAAIVIAFGVATALAEFSRLILFPVGMPPTPATAETRELWQTISSIAGLVAIASALILLGLTLIAVVQRLWRFYSIR
ncbi:hypothetical protein HKCCE3408_18775 [Rhodobacterales bacterium HKCCE3408]|nr:hypothetical protein [Rhodobacterales bacterium HKCCE3408]